MLATTPSASPLTCARCRTVIATTLPKAAARLIAESLCAVCSRPAYRAASAAQTNAGAYAHRARSTAEVYP